MSRLEIEASGVSGTVTPLILSPPKAAGRDLVAVLVKRFDVTPVTFINSGASQAYAAGITLKPSVPVRWSQQAVRPMTRVLAFTAEFGAPVIAGHKLFWESNAANHTTWFTQSVFSKLPVLVVAETLDLWEMGDTDEIISLVLVEYEFVPVSEFEWQRILGDTVAVA